MRVLSFVFTFLLATVVSPVAAAPPATPTTTTVPSSIPSTGSGSDSNTALQPIIDIISSATAQIRPLSDQLISSIESGAPDVDTIEKIDAVVSNAIKQLQSVLVKRSPGVAPLVLRASPITRQLRITVLDLLNVVLTVATTVYGGGNLSDLGPHVSRMLGDIAQLLTSLGALVAPNLPPATLFGAVFSFVSSVVDSLLGIVGGPNSAVVPTA